jgi:hypothetical protein
MSNYYQLRAPLTIAPPVTPLPDYATVQKLTGEIFVKYPLQPTLTPIQLGYAFKAQAELNMIMNEINHACHAAGTSGTAAPSPQQAIEFHQKLDRWYKTLPEELQPHKIVMPHHLHVQ